MTELDYSINPNSRFQVYPSPVASPGKCGVCGAVDRPVVDFNMTIQFYGAVYICVTCFNEAARSMNLVPKTDLIEAQNNLTQSFEQQLEHRNMVTITHADYSDLVRSLSTILGNLSVTVGPTSTAKTESSLFDFNDSDTSRKSGTIEQGDYPPIGERSVSVPKRSNDGAAKLSF